MATGANPVRTDHSAHMRWQLIHGHDATPRQHACVDWIVITEQPVANTRVHAIRTDQAITLSAIALPSSFISQRYTLRGLIKASATCIEVDRIWLFTAYTVYQDR